MEDFWHWEMAIKENWVIKNLKMSMKILEKLAIIDQEVYKLKEI